MIKKLLSLTLIFFIFGLAGCTPPYTPGEGPSLPPEQTEMPPEQTEPSENLQTSKVRFYDIPEGVEKYEETEITIEGERLPLYGVQVNVSQSWSANDYQRTLNGVGMFELEGRAVLTVKPSVPLNYASQVRPLSANIIPIANLQDNTLSFTIESAGEYVLEINGDKYNAVHLFVSEYGEDEPQGYDNVLYFPAGLHTAETSDYIDRNNNVTVNSNTLVYFADGAVVRAKFTANNATHIALAGRGVIDGSAFERDAVKGTVTVPIDFNDCKDVVLRDFTVLDPAGWCVNFYFINGAEIDGIKIISSRSNGDGISLQSCKNITVDGCFVRTWDDSLVVKNYPRWSDRSVYGATEQIVFRNCTLWTDLAQCMEIGYETVGELLSGVTFENITVLHALHNAVISIHNANNARVRDIVYRAITVEDGYYTAGEGGLIDIRVLYSATWSDAHAVTALGDIQGVLVENVKVISARKIEITAGGCLDTRKGYESEHYVDGVTVKNVSLAGTYPTLEQCVFQNVGYLKGFTFLQEGEATGAVFVKNRTQEELARYGEKTDVEFVRSEGS